MAPQSRIWSALLLAGMLAQGGHSQTLNKGERQRAAAELEASRRLLLRAVSGLHEAQWRFKPAPDRWSIAECVEHVALAEDSYYELIVGKLLKSAADPKKLAEVRGKDDLVVKQMADRSSKRITAPALEPKGRWARPSQAVGYFQKSRDRLIRYVRSTKDSLRDHTQAHRAVGLIDGYQWILLASGHVRRHVEQIQEVRAHPSFPGGRRPQRDAPAPPAR